MLSGLSEGRIVHYVLSETDAPANKPHLIGAHRPAIVVNAWAHLGREDGYSNLLVFLDGTNDAVGVAPSYILWATSRVNDETGKPGTWHWPEKV